MRIILAALLFFQTLSTSPLLENDFVRVFRNSAPCAAGAASCGDRVLVALGSMEISGRKMERGDVNVFKTGEKYAPPKSGEYLEVVIKPGHPKVAALPAGTPPAPRPACVGSGISGLARSIPVKTVEPIEPSHGAGVRLRANFSPGLPSRPGSTSWRQRPARRCR